MKTNQSLKLSIVFVLLLASQLCFSQKKQRNKMRKPIVNFGCKP